MFEMFSTGQTSPTTPRGTRYQIGMFRSPKFTSSKLTLRRMWRTLEVNFGIAAACLPAIYPCFRVINRWIGRNSSRRYGSGEKTESEKARIWLDADRTTRNTRTTATARALDSIDPHVSMPEAAILTSTAFGVQNRATSKDSEDSIEKATGYPTRSSKEGAGRKATWDRMRESSSAAHEGSMSKATTSWV